MAQTYTLEEAAERLGIAPEVMKRRLKEDWKTIRSFRDGATLRFRAGDIDELARSLGEVSDPSLQLAPIENLPEPPTTGDFVLPDLDPPPPKKADEPLLFGGDDDLFALPVEEPAPFSPGKGGDSDSDVRLDTGASKSASTGNTAMLTPDELSIDFAGPGSAIIREGSAAKLAGAKSSTRLSATDSNKDVGKPKPKLGESSEFELSLEGDSGDFELKLNQEGNDEVSLGVMPKSKGRKSGDSGIGLRDPVDSGISLEQKSKSSSGRLGKPPQPDSDLDFELSLDPQAGESGVKRGGPKTGKNPPISDSDSEFELSLDDVSNSGVKHGSPKAGKNPPISDSDSEFELSLDDSSSSGDSLMNAVLPEHGEKNNIFETDFEIPPIEAQDDSGSEAVALEGADTDLESSDFDLALDANDIAAEDESASQVVLIEDEVETDEDADRPKSKRRHADKEEAEDDVELTDEDVAPEDEESAAGALAGVKGKSRYDEDDEEEEEEEGEEGATVVAASTPWGVLPALFLAPAFILMILGGLMSFEIIQSMWGYHQVRKPAAPIVRGVANMFDMDVKDQ